MKPMKKRFFTLNALLRAEQFPAAETPNVSGTGAIEQEATRRPNRLRGLSSWLSRSGCEL
jgi:hypothetical protein